MTTHTPTRGPIERNARSNEPRVNNEITAAQIRLVDQNGQMIGVMSRSAALQQARDANLDLVEISPHMDPPVCKLLDYGKFKYEAQKKRVEAKKKQKVIEVKEVQIRPGIEEHDYQVKLRGARGFLEEGNKVKVTLQFRGREMNYQERGLQVLKRLQDDLETVAKVESAPKLEGKRMMMVLGPNK